MASEKSPAPETADVRMDVQQEKGNVLDSSTQSDESHNEDIHTRENDSLPGWKIFVIWLAIALGVLCTFLDEGIIATAIPRITDEFGSLTDVGVSPVLFNGQISIQRTMANKLIVVWLSIPNDPLRISTHFWTPVQPVQCQDHFRDLSCHLRDWVPHLRIEPELSGLHRRTRRRRPRCIRPSKRLLGTHLSSTSCKTPTDVCRCHRHGLWCCRCSRAGSWRRYYEQLPHVEMVSGIPLL